MTNIYCNSSCFSTKNKLNGFSFLSHKFQGCHQTHGGVTGLELPAMMDQDALSCVSRGVVEVGSIRIHVPSLALAETSVINLAMEQPLLKGKM